MRPQHDLRHILQPSPCMHVSSVDSGFISPIQLTASCRTAVTMPNNRLSVLFDRKPRQSKSTSDLSSEVTHQYQPGGSECRQPNKSQSRHALTVMQEYNFRKPLPPPPPPPPAARPPVQSRRPIGQHQHRSSTAPVLYPPDELFLKIIRRRSADARLEEMRLDEQQKSDPELAMSLAIASAVPPMYFDAPPAYTSPDSDIRPARASMPPYALWTEQPEPLSRLGPRGTITKFKDDELFLENHLKLQIDETIAQYASIRVTQPSPMVSPINDIDHMYLERRKQKRREQR